MIPIRYCKLARFLCCVGFVAVCGFAGAQSRMPLPLSPAEALVSSTEYEKLKAENSRLADRLKTIQEKLREAEQRLRATDEAIAQGNAKPPRVIPEPAVDPIAP